MAHESDSDDFGPQPQAKKQKKRVLEFENLYIDLLPSSELYEKSYMHVASVTHVLVSRTDFIITGSSDGQLKFWKKRPGDVEFVKRFYAHRGAFSALTLAVDGMWLASASHVDRSVKVFDVMNFDMINMIQLAFAPSALEWIHDPGAPRIRLACADAASPKIHILDGRGKAEALAVVDVHRAPVHLLKFNSTYGTVISADEKGLVEYWSSTSYKHPDSVNWKFKTETDLFEFAKNKTAPVSLEVSHNGQFFACLGRDLNVRVFNFPKGKLYRKYDESLETARDMQNSGNEQYKLEQIDFGRRFAIEKEIMKDPLQRGNAVFDDSGNFILYATLLGIKIVNLKTNRVVRMLGKFENTERFQRLALYQGRPKAQGQVGQGEVDPTLIATAHDKQRFYMFTRREPVDSGEETVRDVFNEKPSADVQQAALAESKSKSQFGRAATIHTTMGDIVVKLFGDECPKTVENFCTHAQNGYYNNLLFHRVIKNFMIQTGDPVGNGTGGASIWGGEFEDEFHRSLRHDRPYTLSMANAGPNTNGSQFFVTTVACPWLDNKHTVFGRVIKGMDVVQAIERVRCDKDDKPREDIKMVNIDLHQELPSYASADA